MSCCYVYIFLSPVLDHGPCTFTLLEENGYDYDRPDFLSFDPQVVAEQFTLMDAVRTPVDAHTRPQTTSSGSIRGPSSSCLF